MKKLLPTDTTDVMILTYEIADIAKLIYLLEVYANITNDM